VSRWRAWRDLAQHLAVLGVAAFLVVVAAALVATPAGGVVLVALLATSRWVLVPAVDGALRSVVVLRGSRVPVAAEVEPERFLEATCLDTPVGRQRDDVLYDAYVQWCRVACGAEPVAPWVFVERLRSLGLLRVRSPGWEHGLWIGVTLRR
jgi:hypothetical protein